MLRFDRKQQHSVKQLSFNKKINLKNGKRKKKEHGERGGEGEIYGKSSMETYITICKIDRQWEFALWLRKLKQGLCINLEGWDGAGDGKEIQKGGDICIPMADSC